MLKLLEGGIDLVLLRGETFKGERWHDVDNISQNDKRITALLEDPSFREDAKEAFIQQMEMGWEDLYIGRMAIGWRRTTEKLKPWTTKFMNLMIEWGQSCQQLEMECFTVRNINITQWKGKECICIPQKKSQ